MEVIKTNKDYFICFLNIFVCFFMLFILTKSEEFAKFGAFMALGSFIYSKIGKK